LLKLSNHGRAGGQKLEVSSQLPPNDEQLFALRVCFNHAHRYALQPEGWCDSGQLRQRKTTLAAAIANYRLALGDRVCS